MPPSAEEYRAKASECAELAAKTNDLQSKRMLEQTAGQWAALAKGAEKYGAKRASRSPQPRISLTRGGSDRGA
jgi:hypothetical protein